MRTMHGRNLYSLEFTKVIWDKQMAQRTPFVSEFSLLPWLLFLIALPEICDFSRYTLKCWASSFHKVGFQPVAFLLLDQSAGLTFFTCWRASRISQTSTGGSASDEAVSSDGGIFDTWIEELSAEGFLTACFTSFRVDKRFSPRTTLLSSLLRCLCIINILFCTSPSFCASLLPQVAACSWTCWSLADHSHLVSLLKIAELHVVARSSFHFSLILQQLFCFTL